MPYIENALDPKTRAALESHLGKCPRCSEELQLLKRATGAIKGSRVPAKEPVADLWARIEREIAPPVPVVQRRPVRGLQFAGAAVAASILLLAVVNIGKLGEAPIQPTASHVKDTPDIAQPQTEPDVKAPKAAPEKMASVTGRAMPRQNMQIEVPRKLMDSSMGAAPVPAPKHSLEPTVLAQNPASAKPEAEIANDYSVKADISDNSAKSISLADLATKSSEPEPSFAHKSVTIRGTMRPLLGGQPNPGRSAMANSSMPTLGSPAPTASASVYASNVPSTRGRINEPEFDDEDTTSTSVDLMNNADTNTRVAALFSYQ